MATIFALRSFRFIAFTFVLSSAVLSSAQAQSAEDYHRLYWPSFFGSQIESMKLDGTDRKAVNTATQEPIGIDIDVANQKIYWYDQTTTYIHRSDMDGTNSEIFITGVGYAYNIAIDATEGKIYWPNFFDNIIERANLDGTNRETVVSVSEPISITIDHINDKIYWYSQATDDISRANLDGTDNELFIEDCGYVYSMDIDFQAQKLYYPSYFSSDIKRIGLNGLNMESVLTTPEPISVTFDQWSGKVYWYDQSTGDISRADLDGSNNETFISGAGYSYSIVIPHADNTTLPLTLESFSGKKIVGTVALEWVTTDELNSSHFEVERSVTGRAFTAIGTVLSNGNGGSYSFQDRTVMEGKTYFYRLKLIDNDGKYTYSPVITVKYGSELTMEKYMVFPNPVVGNQLNIQATKERGSNVHYRVLDMAGRTWLNGTVAGSGEVNVSSLPEGIYLLQIMDEKGNGIQVTRFKR